MLYSSSLSDVAWEFISPILEDAGHRVKNRKHPLRQIVDACFYVTDNGTKWRNLPNDFPPWTSVYFYFRIWSQSGVWQEINEAIVEAVRISNGRENSPSLASIDSQSQTAEPGINMRGLDGNKRINGRKRHIAVDCLGLLLLCYVTPANVHDSVPGAAIVEDLNDVKVFPCIKKILADNAYKDLGKDQRVGVTIESKEREAGKKGFIPQAFRWAVERSFAWLNRQRRLVRNYEKKVIHQESMNYIGNIRICLKRLDKWWA